MSEKKLINKVLTPKIKIWIEADGEVVFGSGRLLLLQAIEENGSIRQGASKLGMSYRAAWGKIKATEERLGIKLLVKHIGGNNGGAELTPEGKELLRLYDDFRKESYKAVDSLFAQYFEKLLPNIPIE
ncbi:MAG: LysR family transcriptional regulator [Desulfitobacteriaceae bacterium]